MICVLLQTCGWVMTYSTPLQPAIQLEYAPSLASFAGTGIGWIPRDSQAKAQTHRNSRKYETGGRISAVGGTGIAPRAQQPAWRYKPKKSFKYHPKKSSKYRRGSNQKYRAKKSFKYHPKKKSWRYNPRRTWKHRKAASGSSLREL